MKRINISIVGALGKMGQMLIKNIDQNKHLRLYSLTDLKFGKKN